MIENLPLYISLVFGLTTFTTLLLFCRAARNSRTVLLVLSGWLVLQALAGLSGFYRSTSAMPPRFVLMVLPPLLVTAGFFVTARGRRFINGLNLQTLTYLHTVRIPVEIVLYWLSVHRQVPELMTFEGRNFDILAGLTAPFIAWFGFTRPKLAPVTLLIWNFLCLGLLLNIVINAILSAPTPFQQFAFDQPNVAVSHFPFVWLPAFVVPVVLFAHLVAIKRLMVRQKKENAADTSSDTRQTA